MELKPYPVGFLLHLQPVLIVPYGIETQSLSIPFQTLAQC